MELGREGAKVAAEMMQMQFLGRRFATAFQETAGAGGFQPV